MAREMHDEFVYMKLCEGDVIATDKKYHTLCLVEFYNKYRAFNLKKTKSVKRLDVKKGNN